MVVLVSFEHSVILVLWRVGAVLGNGYGIQEQNYVAMYQVRDGWPREVLNVAKTKAIRKWELNSSITLWILKQGFLWANVAVIYIQYE